MNDKEKQQCVICHKDITKELPKIDIYGNHYCEDCYIEKCKYDVMNMRDTILINKELLKRELQYLEEQTRKYTRKETAREILAKLQGYYHQPSDTIILDINDFYEIAKEYGVEVE
jgi:hypothetical protein